MYSLLKLYTNEMVSRTRTSRLCGWSLTCYWSYYSRIMRNYINNMRSLPSMVSNNSHREVTCRSWKRSSGLCLQSKVTTICRWWTVLLSVQDLPNDHVVQVRSRHWELVGVHWRSWHRTREENHFCAQIQLHQLAETVWRHHIHMTNILNKTRWDTNKIEGTNSQLELPQTAWYWWKGRGWWEWRSLSNPLHLYCDQSVSNCW